MTTPLELLDPQNATLEARLHQVAEAGRLALQRAGRPVPARLIASYMGQVYSAEVDQLAAAYVDPIIPSEQQLAAGFMHPGDGRGGGPIVDLEVWRALPAKAWPQGTTTLAQKDVTATALTELGGQMAKDAAAWLSMRDLLRDVAGGARLVGGVTSIAQFPLLGIRARVGVAVTLLP